jgi:hypothetical protein
MFEGAAMSSGLSGHNHLNFGLLQGFLAAHQLLFAPLAPVDQGQANSVVVVNDLAVQAVMALVGIDLAGLSGWPAPNSDWRIPGTACRIPCVA